MCNRLLAGFIVALCCIEGAFAERGVDRVLDHAINLDGITESQIGDDSNKQLIFKEKNQLNSTNKGKDNNHLEQKEIRQGMIDR